VAFGICEAIKGLLILVLVRVRRTIQTLVTRRLFNFFIFRRILLANSKSPHSDPILIKNVKDLLLDVSSGSPQHRFK
jgi:hypothetical protein